MNQAALKVYQAVRQDGTQKNVVSAMQTRAELYEFLDYYAFEGKLDQLFKEEKS
jgi:methylisocitrate lyase